MNIDVATEGDIEELTRVEIRSKKQSVPKCFEYHEMHYWSRRGRWQTYFSGQSPRSSKSERLVLKASDEGNQVIGCIAGHLTTRHNFDGEIQSFYVLKEEQNRGVGSKLFSEFLKWLIAKEAKTLCVGIKPANPYNSFYLKYGGQHLNDYWIFWLDNSLLLKQLNHL